MKTCRKCGDKKSDSEFRRNATSKDGLQSYCKPCHSASAKAWRESNPDRRRVTAQQWKEANREKVRVSNRASDKRNRKKINANKSRFATLYPERRSAWNAVDRAIRSGRIVKPDACSGCGAGGVIHGHHEDYAKPLEVEWLCGQCHSDRHMETRAA